MNRRGFLSLCGGLALGGVIPRESQAASPDMFKWIYDNYGDAPFCKGGFQIAGDRLTDAGENQFRSFMGTKGRHAFGLLDIPVQDYWPVAQRAIAESRGKSIPYIGKPADPWAFEREAFRQYGKQFKPYYPGKNGAAPPADNIYFCVVQGWMMRGEDGAYLRSMAWAGDRVVDNVVQFFSAHTTTVIVVDTRPGYKKGFIFGAHQRCGNPWYRAFPVWDTLREKAVWREKEVPIEVPIDRERIIYVDRPKIEYRDREVRVEVEKRVEIEKVVRVPEYIFLPSLEGDGVVKTVPERWRRRSKGVGAYLFDLGGRALSALLMPGFDMQVTAKTGPIDIVNQNQANAAATANAGAAANSGGN